MPASQCGGDWWMYRKLSNGAHAARRRRRDRPRHPLGDDRGDRARRGRGARGGRRAAAHAASRCCARSTQAIRDGRRAQRADDRVRGGVRLADRRAALRERRAELPVRDQARRRRACSRTRASSRRAATRSAIATSRSRSGAARCSSARAICSCASPTAWSSARTAAGKLFGDRRLRGALTGQPLPDGDALVQLRDRVARGARARTPRARSPSDDITFVLCQFDPPARARVGTRRRVRRAARRASRSCVVEPRACRTTDPRRRRRRCRRSAAAARGRGETTSSTATVLAASSAEEDVVVGAAKREQSLGNVASAVTVISADRIRRFGYRTVGEAIARRRRRVPRRQPASYSIGIRGLNILGDFNTRILVLVDGATRQRGVGLVRRHRLRQLRLDRRHRAHRGDPRPGVVGVRHERVLRHHQHRHARRHRDAARVGPRRSTRSTASITSAGFAQGDVHQQLRGTVQIMDRFGETLTYGLDDSGTTSSTATARSIHGVARRHVQRHVRAGPRVSLSPRLAVRAVQRRSDRGSAVLTTYDTQLLVEGGHTHELTATAHA